MSLQTRFMISVTFLLIILVGSILFVIEKREVKAIFEESKDRGILIAKYIAYLNLDPLVWWDVGAIEKNIEEQIDQKLIFIIFYDRYNSPLAANDFIKDYEDIYCCSSLSGEISEDSYFFESKDIVNKNKNQIMRILEIEVPIFTGTRGLPQKWGSLKIGLSLDDMHKEIQKTRFVLILIGCGGLLLGIVGAALLARRITGPLKKLVDGTVKISKGDFAHKISISSQDEIGNLARSFNRMSSELLQIRERIEEANKRLIQAEKLASIGRISATIAHEIRNPLTSVKLNIQKVLQSVKLDDIEEEHLKISQEGIGEIERFITEFLGFTRVSDLNLDKFYVEQILEESIKMMSDALSQKKIHIEKKFQKNLPLVIVDGDKLRQVFLNILRNSFEAVNEEGKISISLSHVGKEEEGKMRAVISDNGSGIPDKDWENIFEPFYTTKSSGTGLGLAIARKIVEQHEGSIRVIKKEGKGASFEILIPFRR
ncbi:MAG: PAS domain-containing sensor histidine kinase [Candidatus Aminicenantaceae bacterium]